MRAIIRRQLDLPGLPSASGIEILDRTAYVIGDDSPLLYCLDTQTLAVQRTVPLFETTAFDSGRIPKKHKPDLECLTALTTPAGQTGLLICGSGARTQREVGFWVTFGTEGRATVQPLALSGLYAALRPHLPAGVGLNLEAAAASATELLLFQRTVGAATGNIGFRLPLAATWAYVQDPAQPVPPVQAHLYELPTIDGQPAGFSGATLLGEQLFLTASVENTLDPVADGEVLGSFVGLMPADAGPGGPELAQLVLPDGRPYRGKVESIAVYQALGPGQWEVIVVTDDDHGGSTAVVVELTA